MYRRTTGKIIEVSDDLLYIKIAIPLNIKNRNYVDSIFGGSLFSATDPIYMIQLMTILGNNYVVWDKNASIKYKRPAKEKAYSEFTFTPKEIERIKEQVTVNGEFDVVKTTQIKSKNHSVFAEVTKTMYVADKAFYKQKRALKTHRR